MFPGGKRLLRYFSELFLLLADVPVEAFGETVKPISHMTCVVDGGHRTR